MKNNAAKIKLSWVQYCWIFISHLLFAGCIFGFAHRSSNILTITRPLGAIMFLTGSINLFVCIKKRYIICGSRWLMTDGLTAILLSFFPLFNQIIIPVLIPFFFGIWELFSGILKVMDAYELKSESINCWVGFAIIGYVELISGTFSMIKPIDEAVGYNSVISFILFIQCFGYLLKAIMYKNLILKK